MLRKILVVVLFVLGVAGGAYAFCKTGFFKYETACTGFYKTCHYDVLGDDYAISMSCTRICPLTIKVECN